MIFLINRILIWLAIILVFSILFPGEDRKKKAMDNRGSIGNTKAYILDQVYGGETRISNHNSTLKIINKEIANLKHSFAVHDNPLLQENTITQYEDALRRLELNCELLKTKIEFNTNYVKKWRIKLAIHQAEETLLDNGVGGVDPHELIEEDVLVLRPLAERMELCDSEVEAIQILKELKQNNAI